MFRNLFLHLACALSLTTAAQRFEWVSFTPSATSSGGELIAMDADGDLYTVVTLASGTIDIGGTLVQQQGSSGSHNVLIIKWGGDGEVIKYAQLVADPGGLANPYAVAYDAANDHVLLALSTPSGTCQVVGDAPFAVNGPLSILRFDTELTYVSHVDRPSSINNPIALKDGRLYDANGQQSILRRTEANGAEAWSLTTTQGSVTVRSIAVSEQDALYAAGTFMGVGYLNDTITLGGITLIAPDVSMDTHSCIFTLDTAGNVLNGMHLGVVTVSHVTTDVEGYAYVFGSYTQGGQLIGDHVLGTPTTNVGLFVVKLTAELNPVWVSEIHTGGNMEARGITVHPDGHLFVIGLYWGPGSLAGTTFPMAGFGSGFLAKLDGATGEMDYAGFYGSLGGTGRPHGFVRQGDRYYITGRSFYTGANANYGCYKQTYANAYLTCFHDTLHVLPEVQLTHLQPDLEATANVPGLHYQWSFNGEPLEDTGSTILPDANGEYAVTVSDAFGCSASDTIMVLTTPVDELGSPNELRAWPNPGTGLVRLDGVKMEGAEVVILDATGRLHGGFSLEANGVLDLRTLAAGTYVIRVREGIQERYVRFLKL